MQLQPQASMPEIHKAETTDAPQHLPVAGLVVLGLTAFIVILTETLPAGLLPQMARGLDVSEAGAGQLISVYALGTMLCVIPAIAATRSVRRRPLLVTALVGFLVANTVTALVPVFAITLAARFIAGAFAGLVWGMMATYAAGIAPPGQTGRAVAIAMAGTPLALAVGTPLGTWLGTATHWQVAFGALSALAAIAILLTMLSVPDLRGQSRRSIPKIFPVIGVPGVIVVLLVVFTWMAAHYVLYTYIAPFLSATGTGLRPDTALFVFGMAALIGIWLTGVFIDRALRQVTLVSAGLMVLAGASLWWLADSLPVVLVALALWGLAFGGAATQVQTAMTLAAGPMADMAIALLTAVFNLSIFAAAAGGSIVLSNWGAATLPAVMALLALAAFGLVLAGRKAAFPPA